MSASIAADEVPEFQRMRETVADGMARKQNDLAKLLDLSDKTRAVMRGRIEEMRACLAELDALIGEATATDPDPTPPHGIGRPSLVTHEIFAAAHEWLNGLDGTDAVEDLTPDAVIAEFRRSSRCRHDHPGWFIHADMADDPRAVCAAFGITAVDAAVADFNEYLYWGGCSDLGRWLQRYGDNYMSEATS